MKKIIVLLLCLFILCSCGKETNLSKDCDVFEDNPYKIIFNSNGGEEIESIEICENCERPKDNFLPVLTKKGYNFEGWYYDSMFLMKADVKTIDELKVSIDRDVKGCDSKYLDINLYALWTEK